MFHFTFDHIERTLLDRQEIMKRARQLRADMEERFGEGSYPIQEAIDSVIDAAIEYAQG